MTTPQRAVQRHPVAAALLGYVTLALVATWPLALRMRDDLPADLGDPLLNCWILAWVSHLLLAAMRGDPGALAGLWNANIFHPEPLALAFSEHLVPQALVAAPLYGLTGNIVLAYNVLYLATFVLSGLGAFLLVRDLTGSPAAAFVAGVLFAFAPYRADQMPHLQVLSAQWMPFVLLFARRFLASGSLRALAACAAALLVQNLSCGYYIFYFAPFAFAYAAVRWAFGAAPLRCGALLAALFAAMAITAAFVHPYQMVRSSGLILRSLHEMESYSADALSFLTASRNLTLWGGVLRLVERAEGATFPGFTVAALALGAVVSAARASVRATATVPAPKARRWVTATGAALFAAGILVAVAVVLRRRGVVVDVGPWTLRLLGTTRPLVLAALGAALALATSAGLRAALRRLLPFEVGFYAAATLVAAWMALGPTLTVGGWPTGTPSLYRLFYDLVPGFDGVRAPSRMAMPLSLFLAVLAGHALAGLDRAGRRPWIVAAGVLAFAEGVALPLPLSRSIDVSPPEPPRWSGHRPHAIYADVARLPESAVLIELPFGHPGWETQHMYSSTFHWRRLVNGISGDFPPGNIDNRVALRDPLRYPDLVMGTARRTGATHLVVHESAWTRDKGPKVTERLIELGAATVASVDGVTLLAVPPVRAGGE